MKERRKPKFWKQGANYLKRVKKRWRKPLGRDSKLRKNLKGKGKKPSVGYGSKRDKRYLHPSGFEDVLVRNLKDLESIDAKKQAARISSTVGKRKRNLMLEKAKKVGIKVLNP